MRSARISRSGFLPIGFTSYGDTTRDIRSMATYIGDESSVQRPSSISSGPRCNGLKRAASETRRQNVSSAARAPAAPPFAKPSTSTAAFMAPADVPEMPSISSHGSSSRRSSTPQVNAPWEPPPCRARSTRRGLLLIGLVVSLGISSTSQYVSEWASPHGEYKDPSAASHKSESFETPKNRNQSALASLFLSIDSRTAEHRRGWLKKGSLTSTT